MFVLLCMIHTDKFAQSFEILVFFFCSGVCFCECVSVCTVCYFLVWHSEHGNQKFRKEGFCKFFIRHKSKDWVVSRLRSFLFKKSRLKKLQKVVKLAITIMIWIENDCFRQYSTTTFVVTVWLGVARLNNFYCSCYICWSTRF